MPKPKVKLNHAGMAALLKDEGVRADLTARMERVLATAKADAETFKVTGNYLDGLEVQQATTDRVSVRVAGTAPHSHLVEAKHGTLARALDSAGGA